MRAPPLGKQARRPGKFLESCQELEPIHTSSQPHRMLCLYAVLSVDNDDPQK